ncbi:MAG TPA: tRNA (adenosine(37)-N6)-dimethylallyltransferase MiaA [Holophagaceae bacterium]|nr:tRNA (adenosine(37)-N6)-dimethylallyltransferase MiaA [Holophagaceae bacterium]
MNPSSGPIAILGPTASGKSSLALHVARRVGGTVVNGDPYQAIAGLEIGTGQPDQAEREATPHAGYGVLPLSSRPNPADFGGLARGWLESVDNPVLVTGSGLYLRGIWDQLSDLPPVSAAQVARVRRWHAVLGAPRLHRYLAAVDPARASQLHPNDEARIIRALGLHLATGAAPSQLLDAERQGVPEGWRALVVMPERERRRARIEARVAAQFEAGWPAEVARLRAEGHEEDLRALRPLGYEALLEGGDPELVRARIVQETQAFAKRQATWFRNQLEGAPAWDPDAEPVARAFEKLGLP